MLETALIAPILLLIVLGVFEYGLVYRDLLTVDDAVADGARVGSQQGPDVLATGENADHTILNAVRQAMGGLDPYAIDRIVVFEAGPPSEGSAVSQVPATCRTGASSTAARCNVYEPQTAFMAIQEGEAGFFDCDRSGDSSCGWDPTERVDGPRVADIQYLGVYVKLRHDMVTGVLGRDIDIERAAIARLEPGELTG